MPLKGATCLGNEEIFQKELKKLKTEQTYRSLRMAESPPEAWIKIDGRKVLNLCSNNYLGLANHPQLKKLSVKATNKYGCGATASRLIVGNTLLHMEVEKELARFMQSEEVSLFNTGYMANLGVITTLVGLGDIVFSDKLNHASIIDGIILSKAEFRRFHHNDPAHLESLLQDSQKYSRRLIVTDSLFSMDGDFADLISLVKLKEQYEAFLLVDEAHADGIYGPNGRGWTARHKLEEKVDFHLGTLGKAFGCFGAFVAAKKDAIDYLRNKARSFIFSTALPPGVLGSILGAIRIVEKGDNLRRDLFGKAEFVRKRLLSAGFKTMESQSQIIPIVVGSNDLVKAFSEALLKENILLWPIRYPTVPKNTERLRLCVSAHHSELDLKWAVEMIIETGAKLRIIA